MAKAGLLPSTEPGDEQMTYTRRKFVIGMGTVIFFTGPGRSVLAASGKTQPVRYAMIHDETRCNGCNLCARACRKVNHVPDSGSRLSIAHIPVSDNENETQYHFFRHSCQHCEDAPCINVCPTGASYRDENGIVRVNKSSCIGCSYCIGACPYQVRYLNPKTKVADKCDFCVESRLAKGFAPICVNVCPQNALIFGKEDSPEVQAWLANNKFYQYQLKGVGKPHLYRLFGQHLIKKGDSV
ncbi:ferredoxin [Leminorella grimontii]|uniref:Ferredoxin n=2 Tax=Leminorella grimontii TaxID=82981 RepID=A0AAV5N423_9GAMM|nr:ferredoxin-like protein [Leminorella grimontii ATCC 33999 = DSM 5078]GKX56315.1 ferredoxin [Leminorella grimontii]GKX60496.1 ferredoxin [Leminorella grimontii]VFS60748.1 DMSO reductase iron-sulfur subunit [Leminorella grimontii]